MDNFIDFSDCKTDYIKILKQEKKLSKGRSI